MSFYDRHLLGFAMNELGQVVYAGNIFVAALFVVGFWLAVLRVKLFRRNEYEIVHTWRLVVGAKRASVETGLPEEVAVKLGRV